MAHTFQVGAIRCHLLGDGTHKADGGGFFGLIPRVMWQRVITPDADNRIPVTDRSLLIESDKGLILVDTGFGDKLDARARERAGMELRDERLLGDLASLGYSADDIAIVLLTHFHGDHIGGATRRLASGALAPTYPNARYIGQRIDYVDANHPNERTAATYVRDNWQPLEEARLLDLVEGDQEIARGVRTQVAPGHTQALQVVWVESEGESALFLGDAAAWAVHLERLPWVPSFDILPLVSMETKRALRSETLARNTLLLFQHDPHVAAGRLVAGEKGLQVVAELVE